MKEIATTDSRQPTKLQELEDLFLLAEQSAEKIDLLTQEISRQRNQNIYQLIAGYFGLMLSGALFLLSQRFLDSDAGFLSKIIPSSFILVIFIAAGTMLIVLSAVTFSLKTRPISAKRRELKIEYSIQERLISLIDEQMSRIGAEMDVSPVYIALFEIRARRLQRIPAHNDL